MIFSKMLPSVTCANVTLNRGDVPQPERGVRGGRKLPVTENKRSGHERSRPAFPPARKVERSWAARHTQPLGDRDAHTQRLSNLRPTEKHISKRSTHGSPLRLQLGLLAFFLAAAFIRTQLPPSSNTERLAPCWVARKKPSPLYCSSTIYSDGCIFWPQGRTVILPVAGLRARRFFL